MDSLERLAEYFHRFALLEVKASSPLYHRLASGIAGDADLIALASQAPPGPTPNLFLAAVHYLLLKGTPHRLAAFYSTVSGLPPAGGDPFPDFRAFCLDHSEQIRFLLSTRKVQTNEVRRCGILLPSFNHIASRAPGRPLALVEVGASAGLLLLWDQYEYAYSGEENRYGVHGSTVLVECAVRGPRRPPFPSILPRVSRRIGIDLDPVDVRDSDQALWLQAFVWGDQPERAERLRRAIELAATQPLELLAGDALEVLPEAIAGLSPDAVPVVFHSHTLNQFSPEARRQFEELLSHLSHGRRIYRLSLEGIAQGAAIQSHMDLTVSSDGRSYQRQLAHYEPHGEWIEWLEESL